MTHRRCCTLQHVVCVLCKQSGPDDQAGMQAGRHTQSQHRVGLQRTCTRSASAGSGVSVSAAAVADDIMTLLSRRARPVSASISSCCTACVGSASSSGSTACLVSAAPQMQHICELNASNEGQLHTLLSLHALHAALRVPLRIRGATAEDAGRATALLEARALPCGAVTAL
jgi:hypothetical protein